jgi:hypothetical protein
LLSITTAACADTLHLEGGFVIEAESVEAQGEVYRVKTRNGTYDIEKSRVKSIERGPDTRWQYQQEKKRRPDTPEGQYLLAQWCGYNGLTSERLAHLKRVIELNPEHAAARKELGYVKKDGEWVKTRSPKALSDEEREVKRRAREQDVEVRKIVSGWYVKVQAIQSGRLDPKRNDSKRTQFADGRRQILAIHDPFAISALAEVLSRGDVPTRRLLVEALGRYTEDEALMNLIVIALLDPAADVRKAATVELARRQDDRVVNAFRRALSSEREFTLRNAATALGRLKARSAVEDLVRVLSTETVQAVRVTDPLFLDSVYYVFGRSVGYSYSDYVLFHHPRCIGVIGPGALIGTVDRYELGMVSVYRTEVQEALIAITGQNLGFDSSAWLEWWRGQKK